MSFTSAALAFTAMVSPVDACTTAASPVGKTNTVCRMPCIRTSVRSSYSARSPSATVRTASASRAPTARYTVAGSVPCRATSDPATSSGVTARA